jgi:hypothetical protein
MRAQDTADPFEILRSHAYANLSTFRKNGGVVTTPMWFALGPGRVWMGTAAASGKVKRLRNNPEVHLEPCTARGRALGSSLRGAARLLPSSEAAQADRALGRKYGWRRRLITLLGRLRGTERALIEITPCGRPGPAAPGGMP